MQKMKRVTAGLFALAFLLSGCNSETGMAIKVAVGVVDKQGAEYMEWLIGRQAFLTEKAEIMIEDAEAEAADLAHQTALCQVALDQAETALADHEAALGVRRTELEQLAAWLQTGEALTLADGTVVAADELRIQAAAKLENFQRQQQNLATATQVVTTYRQCVDGGKQMLWSVWERVDGLKLELSHMHSQFALLDALKQSAAVQGEAFGDKIAAAETTLDAINDRLKVDIQVFETMQEFQAPAPDLLTALPVAGADTPDPLLDAIGQALEQDR